MSPGLICVVVCIKLFLITVKNIWENNKGTICFAYSFRGFSPLRWGGCARTEQLTSWWPGSRGNSNRKKAGKHKCPRTIPRPPEYYFLHAGSTYHKFLSLSNCIQILSCHMTWHLLPGITEETRLAEPAGPSPARHTKVRRISSLSLFVLTLFIPYPATVPSSLLGAEDVCMLDCCDLRIEGLGHSCHKSSEIGWGEVYAHACMYSHD